LEVAKRKGEGKGSKRGDGLADLERLEGERSLRMKKSTGRRKINRANR